MSEQTKGQPPSASPVPQGRYQPAVVANGLVYTAGMTPRRAGTLVVRGRVGDNVDLATATWAAGLAAGNALLAAAEAAGGLDHIARCVRMTVYIACTPEFTDLSAVADGASSVLVRRLGEPCLPARAAIGVYTLPGGAPVEVELIAALR